MGLEADCHKAVQTTITQLGGLDIIISNAVCSLNLSLANPLTTIRASPVSPLSTI
jgi:hypothetical protein